MMSPTLITRVVTADANRILESFERRSIRRDHMNSLVETQARPKSEVASQIGNEHLLSHQDRQPIEQMSRKDAVRIGCILEAVIFFRLRAAA